MFTDGLGRLCLTYAAEPQAAPTIENVYIQCSNNAGKTYTQPLEIESGARRRRPAIGRLRARRDGGGGLDHAITSADDQQLSWRSAPTVAPRSAPRSGPTVDLPTAVGLRRRGRRRLGLYMVSYGTAYSLIVDKSCDNGATFSGPVKIQGTTSFGVMAGSLLGTGAAAPILLGLEDTMHVAYALSP